MVMISVLRQLPRNNRISKPVSAPAITASRTTPGDGCTHEDRLIAQGLDLQLRGQRCANLRQLLIDAVDDVDGGCLAGLQHAHQHGPPAIEPHHAGLRRVAVADMSNVADVGDAAVARADRQVVQLLDLRRAGIELDEVLERPDLLSAGRQDQILRADGGDDVVSRQDRGRAAPADPDLPAPGAACRRRDRESKRPRRWPTECAPRCWRDRRSATPAASRWRTPAAEWARSRRCTTIRTAVSSRAAKTRAAPVTPP